jgi:hypothetical protein
MSKLWLTLVIAMYCTAVMCQSSNDQSSKFGSASTSPGSKFPLFTSFTVDAGNNAALLKWAVGNVRAGDYYLVEKSLDGIHFETMSAIGTSTSVEDTNFSITDNAVGNGMVYYRIRIAGEQGKVIYSKTISTSLNLVSDFRFYPNPVDKLLIIRSKFPVLIQIMDGYGIIWFSQDVDGGMQIINVSTLQKGNYILKATNRETNSVLSQQLIKN